ncbi:MAG: hypothetical protein ACOC53_03290 [Candidatus Saliniplasma sp.]
MIRESRFYFPTFNELHEEDEKITDLFEPQRIGSEVFEDLESDTSEHEVTHDNYETVDGEVEIGNQDETVIVTIIDVVIPEEKLKAVRRLDTTVATKDKKTFSYFLFPCQDFTSYSLHQTSLKHPP